MVTLTHAGSATGQAAAFRLEGALATLRDLAAVFSAAAFFVPAMSFSLFVVCRFLLAGGS
jgi:hypothetical protein